MAITRSTAADRTQLRRSPPTPRWRVREFAWTLAASALVAAGLYLVWNAKTTGMASIDQDLAAHRIANLNGLSAREDLLPALGIVADGRLRAELARKIYDASGDLSNVGRIRPLVSADQFHLLKPMFVVRTPAELRAKFRQWIAIFFAVFLLVNVFWSLRGFSGDESLLPVVVLLSGTGMMLMVSLRDPVRDNLLFADFAQGAAIGALLMAAAALIDYERLMGRLSFVPLIASFTLSALLIAFGRGPGASDAKVNLLGFQPVEIIRLLLVFFLAGYFAHRWDLLRHARETRPKLAALTRRMAIPPLEATLPVAVCVALSIVFFFLQRDMGPALVFACLFLSLYGVARASALVPAIGLALVVCGFVAGYYLGVPHTVGERVSMWLSPWDNLVHGGDQLAHSLWAFSTGGVSGMGLGMGDPQLVPAAHTDLILSALGEEMGFCGVAAVFGLYAFLVWRALRIGLRARSDYEFFLAAGLAAATALELLLIAAGALGVAPLSGVVTPFLSYGRTAMLANFLLVGILLAISARGGREPRAVFRVPAQRLAIVFAAAFAVVAAKAAYVQVAESGPIMGHGTLVLQADGMRRFQYNPRFLDAIERIPKGSIYDRNGLPLATSDWNELEKHRAEYRELGIDIDAACSRTEYRHYPFGGLLFDLLGDLRTRTRWGASNTAFIERDQARRLRGFDDRPTLVEVKEPSGATERVIRYDYRELVPLIRHHFDPQDPAVRRVLDRPRDVHTSVDARLEVRVAVILRHAVETSGRQKGAAVVLDPANGDLLAAVSLPLAPDTTQANAAENPEANPYLDRARFGLYPPGSTFKVVTAMAALRKDPSLIHKTYECIRLPDGRVGNYIKGSKRPIRDDVQDKEPHGTLDLERGIVVSCNAYFAQLGAYDVGADALFDAAGILGIATGAPNTAAQLKKSLPQSSYGQGQVVASPFQMARVAATVAAGGAMPQGRWITDETNLRTDPPRTALSADAAQTLGRFLREVVTSGTGRSAAGAAVPVAGKTGTAELADAPSHAWFIGFAPYSGTPAATQRKIAFSVLVENGVYGGTAAAPAAAEIVNAAVKLGLIHP
ncbi:MAG: FtsW/RodA/SpoVE family cell cycle protein [Bryobacteraceae bacterium]|jgi:cell division protein FtsW (lipid II flippase)